MTNLSAACLQADQRVFNFSAGPSTLPLVVLEEIRDQLLSYGDCGASVMELSHRSKAFIEIQRDTQQRIRDLLQVPDDYHVLFLQGGGRLQNALIPLNFLESNDQVADYLVTGAWSHYSYQDATQNGTIHRAWDGAEHNYSRLPRADEIEWSADPAYIHFTSNETIHGIQFAKPPAKDGVPLICDSSSDILSRPLAIADYAMIYACAQKNAGIAGVTLVIVRDDLLKRKGRAAGYLSYLEHATADDQMFNTPPTFSIYVTGRVCRWLQEDIGGLSRMAEINREKSSLLYRALDDHRDFYVPHAHPGDRSMMNVVFRTQSPALDERFLAEARRHLMTDLKGHRSLGGIRASIYNAMPVEGAQVLAQFIRDFAQQNG